LRGDGFLTVTVAPHPSIMAVVQAIQPQGQWSSGICDFMDHCGFCCYASWCPCLAYGDLSVKSRPVQPCDCIRASRLT